MKRTQCHPVPVSGSKIYVAGHTGLVGSALVRCLTRAGYSNLVIRSFDQMDLRNQAAVDTFFAQEKPEYVFLAAAKVGGILANNTYKADFIYENVMIAANVIHAAYKHGVKKLLNLGSSCIYPKLALQPLKEEYLMTGPLEATNESYAIAKITAIKLCSAYNFQYKTNFISLMPTNLYGPGDNFNLETAHVLPAIFRKCYLAKLLKEQNINALRADLLRYPLGYGLDNQIDLNDLSSIQHALNKVGVFHDHVLLWGSGQPYREFLYVDALAQAALFAMERYNAQDLGEIVNVGTGVDLTIKDLAYMIKNIVGFEGRFEFDLSKPDGTPKKQLDVSKMTALGWQSTIAPEQGIKLLYEWYCGQVITTHRELGHAATI